MFSERDPFSFLVPAASPPLLGDGTHGPLQARGAWHRREGPSGSSAVIWNVKQMKIDTQAFSISTVRTTEDILCSFFALSFLWNGISHERAVVFPKRWWKRRLLRRLQRAFYLGLFDNVMRTIVLLCVILSPRHLLKTPFAIFIHSLAYKCSCLV